VSRWNTNSSKTAERWPRGNPKIRNPRERSRAFKLDALRNLGVDLTAYLTQSRADRVIELRGGGSGTHVHLEQTGAEGEYSKRGGNSQNGP